MRPRLEREMMVKADTAWTDDEIVMTDMTPDTDFVFDRMTVETINAVDPRPGEKVLDVACGRAIDAKSLMDRGAAMTGIEASDVMIDKAIEYLGAKRNEMGLVRSLAEDLPFADGCFDKVVTKGAMDHFADLQTSMAELVRVTRPGGKIIIAIANFESLTCRGGRAIWRVREKITGQGPGDHPFWEPPEDHNFKFDLPFLRELMSEHCHNVQIKGTSLLWGFPKWGAFLSKLPKGVSLGILKALDLGAAAFPGLSDVLIATGAPKK